MKNITLQTLALSTILLIVTLSCGDSKKQEINEDQNPDSEEVVAESTDHDTPAEEEEEYIYEYSSDMPWDSVPYQTLRDKLPPFNFDQDLTDKSAFELRVLRNTIPARYGYLFMKSDLRGYFYNKAWYKNLMEARWYGDCEYSGLQPAPPIKYTAEEIVFMDKVRSLEVEKKKENFIVKNGLKYANTENIINTWQYNRMPKELIERLGQHGFAIVPNNNVQLFHVYEKNDYSQTQNFVTTDLYLQLFHMHFSFMLRKLEEQKFIPILTEMLEGFLFEAASEKSLTTNTQIKSALSYNAASYSIPLLILDGDMINIPEEYKEKVNEELTKIKSASAATSVLLNAFKEYKFPYDQFKPRGHYTRTEELKKYFNAMQWLQLAPYCLEEDGDFTNALAAAYILNNGKSSSGKSLLDLYDAILTPTTFLIGKPDNLSLIDLCKIIKEGGYESLEQLLQPENKSEILDKMRILAEQKNVIKPKIQNTCPDKINFMPARFVLDNEILQSMVELDQRPYPKGLDVMAGFGSIAAKDILENELNEVENWDQFLPNLEKMQAKYANYENWDESVYAKWIQGLNKMLDTDDQYPYFMQLPQWDKKNLNTALASWAELKHDAILYTEQPSAAECGGGYECEPPPNPYVLGYVEPNVKYWQSAIDILDLTESLMDRHGLKDSGMQNDFDNLRETCTFLLNVSKKELKGEKLTEQEYRTIELIGSSVDYLTRAILDVYEWSEVTGPDKEIAVVADIYTNNQGDKAGILHVAVGYANDIYVLVEIEGNLYITKGGTFSYYEFPTPLDQRLTDEDWQKMLKDNTVYPTPEWMDEVLLKINKNFQPQTVEYIYSSGC
ncbi:MAG: DUF3160 domain-containing protein [Bacteroidota bacterium]